MSVDPYTVVLDDQIIMYIAGLAGKVEFDSEAPMEKLNAWPFASPVGLPFLISLPCVARILRVGSALLNGRNSPN
jgi:hypothetical protein